jgi:prepilin-type N-terminal cleavage/methylation domain-containing protein
MKKIHASGFTLIELLIVIAIIGILVAVIGPNLNASRSKGQEAAFKTEMDNFRKQAETFFSNGTTYLGLFTTDVAAPAVDDDADDAVELLISALKNKASDGEIYGQNTGGDYVIYARIPNTDPTSLAAADIWCIDSLGTSGNPSADATDEFTVAPTACW